MATTLNLNSLPEYIEQHRDELITKASVGAKTLDYIELMLGVKHKEALNYLDSEVEFQEANCGWTPKGSDTFSQKVIEVKPIEIEKEWCYLDFKNYFMNYQLRFAAGRETLPFEEALVNSNLDAIKDALEKFVWQAGDSVEGFGLKGFWPQAQEVGTAANVADGATATQAIDAVVAKLTARMLAKGVDIFVSPTAFRNYVMESNGTCCANRPILDAASESIVYAGDSRVRIIPVAGLEGMGIVAASRGNLVYGTDIEDSESIFDLFFDKKEQKYDFRVLFNAGMAIKYNDEVVYTKWQAA